MNIEARLKKIEVALKPDYKNCYLLALVHKNRPEESKYMMWDGVPGSGNKSITQEEWEAAAQTLPEGRVVQIIDDI